MDIKQLLAPLGPVNVAKSGPTAYYRVLTGNADPILAMAGWLALIFREEVRQSDHPSLLPLCVNAGLRDAAFKYFSEMYETELARAVVSYGPETSPDPKRQLMLATLDDDRGAMREAELAIFLSTGDTAHLKSAAQHADALGGWRVAVPDLVRLVAVNPWDPGAVSSLGVLIESSNDFDLLMAVATALRPIAGLADILDRFEATAMFEQGQIDACIKKLDAIDARNAKAKQIAPPSALIERLRAKAAERQGNYKAAFQRYGAMNRLDAPSYGKSTGYIAAIQTANALAIPALPPTGRDETVMMLGFPRSGTTLLENAIAAHPKVETFEEIPSVQAIRLYIERGYARLTDEQPGSKELFLSARERFYSEIARRQKKQGATVFVDKMPIRSMMAPFLSKVLPDQKYIFSIRHPYDVAMICFQQRFKPNPAMANFLNLVDTTKIYDIAMTNWFSTFDLQSSNVCYVRYDELVTDFRDTAGRVVDFLGLEWDDDILDFAKKADSRATRTPSYQKVRQGLSIGVQSRWRNYAFLFEAKEVAALTKWAKFFGYETV